VRWRAELEQQWARAAAARSAPVMLALGPNLDCRHYPHETSHHMSFNALLHLVHHFPLQLLFPHLAFYLVLQLTFLLQTLSFSIFSLILCPLSPSSCFPLPLLLQTLSIFSL
jgi:hypothetical protein